MTAAHHAEIAALGAAIDLGRRVPRELALQITWDDAAAPSVWAPLGDFFGTAPGANRYRALPLGVTDGGFYSH